MRNGMDEGALLEQIPYLRRHARLLTGSQAVGDEYVRLCLEMVMDEPGWLEGPNLRVQLFRAFHSARSSIAATLRHSRAAGSGDLSDQVEEGLAALPEPERQAMLLVLAEGFTPEQAATILDMSVDEVTSHVQTGRGSLQARVAVPVLIIEDEPIIAADIARIVEEMGHRVIGVAAREERSIALAGERRPGLVLADVKLEGSGNGISAARSILEDYQVPIVFVTGYPELLLTGHGLEPAFVVSKPFVAESLKVTIAQALATYAAPVSALEHKARLLEKLREITGRGPGLYGAELAR